jgi:Fe-S-cluster containining protein
VREYQPVDLHALAAEEGFDLKDAFAKLADIYREVDARNAANTKGLDLPCHRGCDMCCHESVFLTPLEFFYVWDWAQQNLEQGTLKAIVQEGLALYSTHRERIDAFEHPPPEGQRDHFSIAKDLKFTCPLLGPDGACRVYPVRELLARLFGCSFNEDSGIYGCHLVAKHLAGKTVTLLPARSTARRLHDLPLTHKRQVYPYYFNLLYG